MSIGSRFDQSSRHTVYVIRGLHTSLLRRPAIQALHVLQRPQVESLLAMTTDNSGYKNNVISDYPQLLTGLGETLGTPHHIHLADNATPYSLCTPCGVPVPLIAKVDATLGKMESQGVIRRIDELTEWCAGMFVVPKSNGDVHVCGDFKKLNHSIQRERHILPSVEHLLANIVNATIFSKLDANSGYRFHQIPSDEASQCLTTFITPSGRHCYRHLTFGISSAPEFFPKRMPTILDGLPGINCLVDDILIFGPCQEEHDQELQAVLQHLASAGLTLNGEKCLFSVSQLRFCVYLIGKDSIWPDPAKVTALTEMPACKDVQDVRCFLELANQLGRFSPNLASLSQPLHDLLVKRNSWCWTESHQTAFDRIKADLSSQPVLALYSPNYETVVSADASSYGLGSVLTQRQPDTGHFRPVVYLSRSLTDTERGYSQIEKEAPATIWACESVSNYHIGLPFTVETDHKPLVPLLGTKALDELPPRVLRFRLRLMRYQFNIVLIPGKNLITADALSQAPADVSSVADSALESAVDAFMAAVTDGLPATDQRLQEILTAQQDNPICTTIGSYCSVGWPPQDRLSAALKPYWPHRSDFSSTPDGLLLFGQRILDYYSRFIEIALMTTMTTTQTIRHMQSMFARHGFPQKR